MICWVLNVNTDKFLAAEDAGAGDRREVGEVDKLACIAICIVVTVITNRILAIHTFNVIDGYITDTCNEIIKIVEESIRNAHINE